MAVEYRRATPDDAPALIDVKCAVWPANTHHRIADVLRDPAHITILAVMDGQLVGYMDSFMTTANDGTCRWEMDQLAVVPDCRGRGIGRQLVTTASRTGYEAGASIARALIQVTNTASQRAFARVGYGADGGVYRLYVCDQAADGEPVSSPDLIPVMTFSYGGLWIEGAIDPEKLLAARRAIAQDGYELAGTLIHVDDEPARAVAIQAGYRHIEDYHWWNLDLSEFNE